MKRFSLFIIVLLLLLALPSSAVLAASRNDNVVGEGETVNRDISIYGGHLEVKTGGTVNGNVFIYGGNAILAGDINGDVTIFGGNAQLSGSISGDLVLFGGNLTADDTAAVSGDCVLLGGNVTGEGRTGIHCAAFGSAGGFRFPNLSIPALPALPMPSGPPFPPTFEPPRFSGVGPFFYRMSEVFGRTLALAILALVVAALAPNQVNRVSNAITEKPVASGVIGLLTAVAIPSLATLLLIVSIILTFVCIGILGYPIVLLLVLGLAAAGLVGWVAVGNLLGRRLASSMQLTNRSLIVTAALGTAVLTLVLGLVRLIPFGGFGGGLLTWILICMGLGAVALTQFGTKPYPPESVPGVNTNKVDSVLATLPEDDDEPPIK